MSNDKQQGVVEMLELAARYLEHPEVQGIPFALPPTNTAKNLRDYAVFLKMVPEYVVVDNEAHGVSNNPALAFMVWLYHSSMCQINVDDFIAFARDFRVTANGMDYAIKRTELIDALKESGIDVDDVAYEEYGEE